MSNQEEKWNEEDPLTAEAKPVESIREHSWNMKDYVNKAMHISQMDVEYTIAQVCYCLVSPSKLYMLTKWRKQTKGYWARDDPCFFFTLLVFLAISSVSYSLLQPKFFASFWKTLILFAFGYFGLGGLFVAILSKFVAEKNIRTTSLHTAESKIELCYAFDIHCNSFVPLFFTIFILQFVLLPLLLMQSLVGTLCSNLLYCSGISHYFYITFKGYSTLPYIQNREFFLLPIVGISVLNIILIVFGVNPTIWFLRFITFV